MPAAATGSPDVTQGTIQDQPRVQDSRGGGALRLLHHEQRDAPALAVPAQPHGQTERRSATTAASSRGGCNSPGESLSCSFIFDILMTTTAQDCEKGRGCLSSCRPRGDAGTGNRAPCAGKRLFQQISSLVRVPLRSNQFHKAPSPASPSLVLISWKKTRLLIS